MTIHGLLNKNPYSKFSVSLVKLYFLLLVKCCKSSSASKLTASNLRKKAALLQCQDMRGV